MNLETTTYRPNHNTFGGLIYPSDFDTNHEGTRNIAERIVQDQRFDEQCRKNIEGKERNKKNA